jgi:hypothetical protein
MMFYERVAPLNEARHVALKVLPAKTFAYAARTNSVPIVGSEFFECAREYPIVFVQGQTCPLPAVLLGLRENENLYRRRRRVSGMRATFRPSCGAIPLFPATGAAGRVAGLHRRGISPCFQCCRRARPCIRRRQADAATGTCN